MVRGMLVSMRLRDGSYHPGDHAGVPGVPGAPGSTGAPGAPGTPGGGDPADGVLRWRVSGPMVALKGAGVVAFALVALVLRGDAAGLAAAGAGALLLAGYVLRDLLVPVRVAADRDGVTVVTGFAGRRRLDWAAVERVRVDDRQRLGTRSRLLEIDAGESLFLFGAAELGAPVEDVVAELDRLLRQGPAVGRPPAGGSPVGGSVGDVPPQPDDAHPALQARGEARDGAGEPPQGPAEQ